MAIESITRNGGDAIALHEAMKYDASMSEQLKDDRSRVDRCMQHSRKWSDANDRAALTTEPNQESG